MTQALARAGLITVVVGGQFGSEAKGNAVKWLAEQDYGNGQPHVAVRVGGSQAGHTGYDLQGREWKLRHVPIAAVANPDALLAIAAGSEIDPEVLLEEITTLEDAGISVIDRLYIHPMATVITPIHKMIEAEVGMTAKLGSTAKGVGAARADRVMRNATLWREVMFRLPNDKTPKVMSDDFLNEAARHDAHIVIEGVQGYGLGLHTQFYPFCTSADARAIDFLAMAGISPWSDDFADVRVLIVFRTRPIRVAGNSGPMATESTWADLGLPEEHTTVTKKVRRVAAEFDWQLAIDAIKANGGSGGNVFAYLSMLDQIDPTVKGLAPDQWSDDNSASLFLDEFEDAFAVPVVLVSTGPDDLFGIDRDGWV